VALLCASALAQPTPQTSGIPTVTRLVKIFSELEAGLYAQARAADPAALERSLAPAFEMRDARVLGAPIARDEWIRNARSAGSRTSTIDQMAVHDLGGYALISFREVRSGTVTPQRFVIDCWKRDGDGWVLAIRYVSDISASTAKLPAGSLEKRY
jgi:uncharacterized protein DUF4440